jgi:deferrochelatase/peroxidase EfeB
VVAVNGQIRLATPEQDGGFRLLRQATTPPTGGISIPARSPLSCSSSPCSGDPHVPFTFLQTRLGRSDLLNGYIAHLGGVRRACPPEVNAPGDWFGMNLFD